jgi:hypothetical protein
MSIMAIVNQHIHQALMEYSSDGKYLELLKAKTEYFQLTGNVNEDDEEYESRMSCFNEWFLFQYAPDHGGPSIMGLYLQNNQVEPQLALALLNINYSLFEFVKVNYKNRIILEDILHGNDITLAHNHEDIAFVPKDFFVGRVFTFQNQSYLLQGKCLFPMEVKSICKKQAKKIRKLKDIQSEVAFLMSLESLKTKWTRYGHINVTKIFTFA